MRSTCNRLKFAAAVLALAWAPSSALFAQDYEIRLERPDPVGSKLHLSTVAKESTSYVLKQGDKVLEDKSTKYTVEAELVVTVLAMSEKHKNTRVKIEVEKLTRIEGDSRTELAPKGSVITASWDGKDQSFEMAGGGLEPDTEESLRLLDLVTDDPNGPTDDELFGTKERKKVGDHWDGNAELMAKQLSGFGATAKKEDLKMTVTLEKLAMIGKTECLQVICAVTCDKFAPPLPPGITVEKGSVKSTFNATIPTATSLVEPGEGSTDILTTVTARGNPDPTVGEVVLQMTSERSMTERTTEVK